MIMNDKFIIKSISYYSSHISVESIVKVESVRLFSSQFLKIVFKAGFKFRYHFFNPLFWKLGIAIHLSDGKIHFFSVSDTTRVKSEIESFMVSDSEAKPVLRSA